ncbi:MAG: Flp pilus assembly complex ATPase component TadA [Planctomycetes bacterium]|nr:Flp pilus assembly complex ATPase component TadA [Planctomycetota bacterium]
MISFNRRVLRILEEASLLDAGLAKDLAAAAAKGESVVGALLQRNAIAELDLLGILAERLGVPPIDLDRVELAPEFVEWMPQELAERSGCVPVAKMGSLMTIAVSNPFDVVRQDDLRIASGCDLRVCLALESQIARAKDRLYKREEQDLNALLDEGDEHDITVKENREDEVADLAAVAADSADAPIVKLVNMIIYQGIKAKASDIHVEPFEKRTVVRYRVDGSMAEAMSPPKRLQNSIASRLKIMASLDIAEKRRPQDGKFQVKVEGRQIDFRVSVLPTVHGEKVVLRILDSSNLGRSLDSLGFEPEALADFKAAIDAPYGMILVTGPTGSGKTTTLYSAVREMLTPEMNFVTVEDPVEYQLDGVNQVQVNVKRGLTFAGALRSILRQDPDIVMVGEIRDTETIDIAVKAALTGHLVLSTLHTNDAASTITRMCDMGVDPFMVSSSTLLVSAQRLMRRLCEHCREPIAAPKDRLLAVGCTPDDVDRGPTLFRAVGCPRCSGGYAGRFAILETLPIRDDIKRLIVDGKGALDIRQRALETGMVTLRRCALLNALRGKSTIEEALRVTLDERRRTAEPGTEATAEAEQAHAETEAPAEPAPAGS